MHSMAFQDRRLQPLVNPFLHYSMPRGTAAKRVHSYAGYVTYNLAQQITTPLRRLEFENQMQHSIEIGSDSEIRPAQGNLTAAEATCCRDSVDNSDSPMSVKPLPTLLQASFRSARSCSQDAAAKHSVKHSDAWTMKSRVSTKASLQTSSAESTPRCHRRCCGSAPAGLELRHPDSGGDLYPGFAGADEKTTTVMMRNLPATLCLKGLIQEINGSGFKERFDFCYIPVNFSTGRSQGFAFVNFLTAEAARCFFREWHGSPHILQKDCPSPLNLSAAGIQGLEDNLAKWNTARKRRIKNAQHRPYVASRRGTCRCVSSRNHSASG